MVLVISVLVEACIRRTILIITGFMVSLCENTSHGKKEQKKSLGKRPLLDVQLASPFGIHQLEALCRLSIKLFGSQNLHQNIFIFYRDETVHKKYATPCNL